MKNFIVLFCFLFIAALLNAQEVDRSFLKDYDTALIIYNRSTRVLIDVNPANSARRLSPCSTFKIYNTLIGLELGLIKGADSPWYKWDGNHRDIDGWNQDLTLRDAFRVSAVPAYQILARQIGIERMKTYIDQIDYGTKDISAGIDIFWLYRQGTVSIMISATEQVLLLNKLLDGKLPFAEQNFAILRDVMEVVKTEKGTLYGKTGSGMDSDGKWFLGWFVGFLEHNGTTYIFACNVTGGESPSGKAARTILENVFKSQGLL
ncbi:MAG: penicillin-binding transpeptidase domain-containing protein [Candidatus Auribacterota bacterium]|nr:penicillin-binding transpeptidase domain-containing protein [Candidatus Auribacterota bacterium]